MRTRETVNKLITYGTVVEYRRSDTRKWLEEVMRCTKCQRLNPGHCTATCPSTHDVCAHCAGHHRTTQCLDKNKQRCANCVCDGHPAWSKTCLAYERKLKQLLEANPENRYKYYVTEDRSTWILANSIDDGRVSHGLPTHLQHAQQLLRSQSSNRG